MTLSLDQVLRVVLPLLAPNEAGRAPTSLDDLAHAVALSTWHAHRSITRVLGETPASHGARRRIEAAAVDLLTTDRRILDIALDAGYGSHEAFTRAFVRRFGVAPQTYRRLVGSGSSAGDAGRTGADSHHDIADSDAHTSTDRTALHAALLAEVGPCVHLLRVSLAPSNPSTSQPRSTEPMTTDIEVERRSLVETPTLHQVRKVEHSAMAEALADILPAVYTHVLSTGASMAGKPYVRYLSSSPAFFTIEAGIPLAEARPAAPEAGIEAGALPGGKAAVLVHCGSYDTLGASHAALDRWIETTGEAAAGPPWESYLTDPAEHPDPADWRTEIIWPLVGDD